MSSKSTSPKNLQSRRTQRDKTIASAHGWSGNFVGDISWSRGVADAATGVAAGGRGRRGIRENWYRVVRHNPGGEQTGNTAEGPVFLVDMGVVTNHVETRPAPASMLLLSKKLPQMVRFPPPSLFPKKRHMLRLGPPG